MATVKHRRSKVLVWLWVLLSGVILLVWIDSFRNLKATYWVRSDRRLQMDLMVNRGVVLAVSSASNPGNNGLIDLPAGIGASSQENSEVSLETIPLYGTVHLRFLGLVIWSGDSVPERQWSVQWRFWQIMVVLWLPVWLWLPSLIKRKRRAASGRCPECGYDLRATPDRCPECGAAPGHITQSNVGTNTA